MCGSVHENIAARKTDENIYISRCPVKDCVFVRKDMTHTLDIQRVVIRQFLERFLEQLNKKELNNE